MEQYVAVQFNATGVFGYSFRRGKTERFCISYLVTPNPDVTLSGFHQELYHRNYDGDITLVSGVRRNFTDSSGNIRGYYEYTGQKEFNIVAGAVKARVYAFCDGWRVFAEGVQAAELVRLPISERKRFEENGYEMESRFLVNIFGVVDFSIYPYIMAIPVLGFSWRGNEIAERTEAVSMEKICEAFYFDDPDRAFEHIDGNYDVVADYGEKCNGHSLYTWDDGGRMLAKCRICGGYILIQKSEFHGMEDDAYYREFIPVKSEEQAAEINRDYGGYELETKYPERYLIADPGKKPHWSV